MNACAIGSRIGLVAFAVLLTLPFAQQNDVDAARQRTPTVTREFANARAVTLETNESDDPVKANPYPSQIEVNGLKKGRIRDVNVTLNNFTHLYPDDVQILLIGPGGQTAILMSKAGGSSDVLAIDLTVDDDITRSLPDQDPLQSGVFRPTNVTGGVIDFLDLNPDPGPNSSLSVFDGTNPNGIWRLYVQDEYAKTDPGVIAGGWTIEIEADVQVTRKRRPQRQWTANRDRMRSARSLPIAMSVALPVPEPSSLAERK